MAVSKNDAERILQLLIANDIEADDLRTALQEIESERIGNKSVRDSVTLMLTALNTMTGKVGEL